MWDLSKLINKGDYYYAKIIGHPNATVNGYVLLHRAVVENSIGRLLTKDEIVHHKDDNSFNNAVDNLEILTQSKHAKQHRLAHGQKFVRLKCPWCKTIFEIREGNIFLHKKSTLKCTCCSRSCRGKLSRKIQTIGMTDEIQQSISENIISIFTKYTPS